MKKIYLAMLILLSGGVFCQTSSTIAIQFYFDSNNDCTYNPGEPLYYNVPGDLYYASTSTVFPGGIASVPITGSFSACGPTTLYVWAHTSTATNTIQLASGSGITPKLSCGSFTNLPYNSGTVHYLPVTVTGTSNVGVSANFSSWPNSSGGTPGVCANSTDSLFISFNVGNVWNCSGSNTLTPRSYTLYLDGVQFETFSFNTAIYTYSSVPGSNTNTQFDEFYTPGAANIWLTVDLPSSFTVVGSHTLSVRSGMIYNNSASVMDWNLVFNSVPCNKISGKFFNDCNSNCVFDGNDSYGVGHFATGVVYNTSNGFSTTFHPDWNGNFSLFLPATMAYSLTQYPTSFGGTSTLIPSYTACSNSTLSIPGGAGTNTFTFGYKTNYGGSNDPWVYLGRVSSTSQSISPTVGAVFGVYLGNYWYNICATASLNPGTVKVTIPNYINFVSNLTGPTPTVTTGSSNYTLTYAVPNFTTYMWSQFATFSVTVSSTAVPGTTCTINTQIFPTVDANTVNNNYDWTRVIGGPFDPNGKYASAPGMKSNGDVPFGTSQLNYEIGFQNIGNAPAINVTTLDTIDVNFDLNSIRVLQSSYPVSMQIDQVTRAVAFHFRGINLPDHVTDEPGSHGFVKYSINLKPGVPSNTVLKNRAHNYFDFMEPVATNQTSNKLVITVGLNENAAGVKVRALPNPVSARLQLEAPSVIGGISVYSLSGQLMITVAGQSTTEFVDMQSLSSGIYFVKVRLADSSESTFKVVKQ